MKLNVSSIPGAELHVGDTSYLYFGGTSYLGMQSDPQFREILAEFTLKIGPHWGASRAGNLVLSVYEETESALSKWVGSEACLTLSSGFMAARLLVEYYATQGHPCFFSPNCHEALLPPGGKRAPDWNRLRKTLEQNISKTGKKTPVVFTDTVGGNEKPGPMWDILNSIPKECILVADDSHGIGICGRHGSGSWSALSEMGFSELLVCGSLGKAMAVTSGMVAGPAQILKKLRETPFFAGASPAPPAGLAALGVGLREGHYEKQHKRLLANITYFCQQTGDLHLFKSHPEYPVFYFTDPKLAAYLRGNRILITDFEYAAEAGTSSPKRLVITAAHQKGHLDQLVTVLGGFKLLSKSEQKDRVN